MDWLREKKYDGVHVVDEEEETKDLKSSSHWGGVNEERKKAD